MYLHDAWIIRMENDWRTRPAAISLILSGGEEIKICFFELERAWLDDSETVLLDRIHISNVEILHGECSLSDEEPGLVELRLVDTFGMWICFQARRVTIEEAAPSESHD
jgi:hypothetical protein